MAFGIGLKANRIAQCVALWLRSAMHHILATIENALEKKGLSAAAASRLAVGNPSLIKNMRSDGAVNKRFNAEALQKLADVLGLEFYFGEPREETSLSLPGGFSERTVEPFSAALARREALEMGFLPVPYHIAAAPNFRGTAPVALSRQWLLASGFNAESLAFLPALTDDMAPILSVGALALIDASRTRADDDGIWAIGHGGRYTFARVQMPSPEMMILKCDRPNKPVQIFKGGELRTLKVIGRVVWCAQQP